VHLRRVNIIRILGTEALTAVDMKSTVVWDVAPRGPLKIN
jgi:hypothetical protein